MAFTYPVSERVLKKWSGSLLSQNAEADGAGHFVFTYHGSTCNNGGTAFTALMHIVLSGEGGPENRIIRNAWIEIPEDQEEGASQMCAAPGRTPEEAKPFFQKLAETVDFSGRGLEDVLTEKVPENFAGCFCGRPHVSQKWKIALATVHYAISG
jgi:hypothetical protein